MRSSPDRPVAGAPLEVALASSVARLQGEDPLAPVYVVVRTATVGAVLRRQLARWGALAGVRFGPLGVLVERVIAGGGLLEDRRPLTRTAARSAARVVLSEQPGMLAAVAEHPETESSLAATYEALAALSDAEVAELAAVGRGGGNAADLVIAVRGLLRPHFSTRADRLAAATRLVGSHGVALVPGPVVVYLPDQLDPAESEFLECLGAWVEVVVLEGAPAESEGAPSGRKFTRFVSAPDPEVEVREAVRRVVAHAERGGDMSRCVLTYPDGGWSAHYGQRLGGALRSAGLAWDASVAPDLSDTPEGRALTGLMELAEPRVEGREMDRASLFRWLRAIPLSGRHGMMRDLLTVPEGGPAPIGLWDRCSRAAGVLAGLGQWRERLGAYASAPERMDPGTSAEGTYDLLTVVERVHSLTATASASSWSGYAAWARGALEEILPASEGRQAVADAIDELDCLDIVESVAGLGAQERLSRFGRGLRAALACEVPQAGPRASGPIVGPLGVLAGAPSELLVVLGCTETGLPGRAFSDPLLSRSQRVHLAGLGLHEPHAEQQRRHLEQLLDSASSAEGSFPRIDVEAGRTNYPSRWIHGDLLSGHSVEIPSFYGSLRRLAAGLGTPLDATELELAAISGVGRKAAELIGQIEPDFARRASSLRGRRRGGMSRFGGYVGTGAGAESVWERAQSATALEELARCPFIFFMSKMLRVEHLPAPEELVLVDPRERGTLIHDVLERFFAPYAGNEEVPQFGPEERSRLAALADEHFAGLEAAGKTGKALFWASERRTIARDLQRFVAKDVAASAAASLVPIAVELDFGRSTAPVVIPAGENEVRFRGRIDRIDRAPDGSLVVADYKSGRSDNYRDIAKRPLGKGTHLQLPIYAKAALMAEPAASSARAEYRFVQSTADYAVIPVQLTDELDAELSGVLGALVSTVANGCFPPRPGPQGWQSLYENCRYCDYDTVCSTDRAGIWARATWDPLLKHYVDLVEPLSESPATAAPEAVS